MDDVLKMNNLEEDRVGEPNSSPSRWEPEQVGRALVRAFVTLDRLPRLRGPREPGGHWPRHAVEWVDQLAQAELEESERRLRERTANRTIIRPSGAEIAQMEAAFDWLRELRNVDSGMALVTSVWALRSARGRSVKALCSENNWAPHTFYRKRSKALNYLAGWLNERRATVF
ncbi:hypothetical protein [Methylocapsa palsarum]|uniref:Uncharacterized protein n=1 Tax=Methylocapsa palsarum TaxID=1612308 RepID=A0A1I4BG94_9HYPH|nr:hypothetical protein [Methylocapsa palsarum]SFK67187.1 hypothetical protein SAMN05444581_11494 [Methylocapsa palsarum]